MTNLPSIEYLAKSITHLQSFLALQNRALPTGAQQHSLTIRLVYVTRWETQKTDRAGVYKQHRTGGRWILTSELAGYATPMGPGEEISAQHDRVMSLYLTTNTKQQPFQASARALAQVLLSEVQEYAAC